MMNLGLAFHKAQHGPKVQWVGHDVHAQRNPSLIDVAIKEEFMEQLLALTLSIDSRNQVSRKELRSYTGKANHVSTLVWSWKPFLDCLWAACESRGSSNAGYGCVWTKQFKSSLRWLRAFMTLQKGEVRRQWSLEAFLNTSDNLLISFDASPWGLGAVLYIGGISCFFLRVSSRPG